MMQMMKLNCFIDLNDANDGIISSGVYVLS